MHEGSDDEDRGSTDYRSPIGEMEGTAKDLEADKEDLDEKADQRRQTWEGRQTDQAVPGATDEDHLVSVSAEHAKAEEAREQEESEDGGAEGGDDGSDAEDDDSGDDEG